MIRSPSALNTSANAAVKADRDHESGPWRFEAITHVHGESAGLLHRPRAGRACGHSAQVNPAGPVLDEHRHVQPLEQHRLDDQKVAAMMARLSGEELPP